MPPMNKPSYKAKKKLNVIIVSSAEQLHIA